MQSKHLFGRAFVRVTRLEARSQLVAKVAFPAWALVVAWITYEGLMHLRGWESNAAYEISVPVFAGLWLWLVFKWEMLK
jgi:hypothetical protein